MCGSMVDIQSLKAEIRRGKKKKERQKPRQKYWPALFHRVAIIRKEPYKVSQS